METETDRFMKHSVQYVSSLYGGFWNFDIKDFCYLVNPYFPPDDFIQLLKSRLDELVRSYPSTNWYLSSLAAKTLGLTENNLVVANGASELINALINRHVAHLAIPVPTFDEYPNRALGLGKKVSPFVTQDDFGLDPEHFIEHIKRTKANSAVIVNPNNPTGRLISEPQLWYLLESMEDLDLVIVDESFIDFANVSPPPTALNRLPEFQNVVVLKSLSKVYGIPGLRLGYAVSANSELVATMRSDVPIWSINSLAQFFLENLGAYQEMYRQSCTLVTTATQALYENLKSIPYLQPYPSHGNFVLCKTLLRFTGSELSERLFDEFDILINNCGHKQPLSNHFVRIASRTSEENLELIQSLQSL